MLEYILIRLLLLVVGLLVAVGAIGWINRKGHLTEPERRIETAPIQAAWKKIVCACRECYGGLLPPLLPDDPRFSALPAEEVFKRHLRLPEALDVSVQYARLEEVPGLIERLGHGRYVISVDDRYKEDSATEKAVLAHEFSHIWVDLDFPEAAGMPEHERFVDIAAAACGMGALIMGAMRQLASLDGLGVGVDTDTFGYMTPAEFGYAVALHRAVTECDETELLRYLPPVATKAFNVGAAYLASKPTISSGQDGKIVLECCICFQRVRVPMLTGKNIEVTCPACRSVYLVRFAAGLISRLYGADIDVEIVAKMGGKMAP